MPCRRLTALDAPPGCWTTPASWSALDDATRLLDVPYTTIHKGVSRGRIGHVKADRRVIVSPWQRREGRRAATRLGGESTGRLAVLTGDVGQS